MGNSTKRQICAGQGIMNTPSCFLFPLSEQRPPEPQMPVLSTGSQIAQWHSSFKVLWVLIALIACYIQIMKLSHCRGVMAAFSPAQGFLTQPQPAPLLELLVQLCEQILLLSLWVTKSCTPNLTSAPAGGAQGKGGTVTARTPCWDTPGGSETPGTAGMCTAHLPARRFQRIREYFGLEGTC